MQIPVYDPQNLHVQLESAFGLDALKLIGAIVVNGHLEMPEVAVDTFGPIVGGDPCRAGYIRWGRIEADLFRLRHRFPGVTAGFVANTLDDESDENGGIEMADTAAGRHVEVTAGAFRLLFQHNVDPDSRAPRSEYGRSRARSNEPSLFGGDEPAEEGAYFFATVFHTKGDSGAIPVRLQVRFPISEAEFAADALNLFDKFPELHDEAVVRSMVAALRTGPVAPVEVVEEALPPLQLKEMPKRLAE